MQSTETDSRGHSRGIRRRAWLAWCPGALRAPLPTTATTGLRAENCMTPQQGHSAAEQGLRVGARGPCQHRL